MAQLVLFDNTDGPGPDEFVVIDVDDLDDEGLIAEYGAKIVTKETIFLNSETDWPYGQSLSVER